MPTSPNLSTARAAGSTGHLTDTNTVHGIVNNIYKVTVGTTRTAAFTVAQTNSGETAAVNVSSSVAITVPSLEQGTVMEFVQTGTAGFTLTASGVSFVVPTGATATPRVQGSVVSLLWLTTTSVLVGGDLT